MHKTHMHSVNKPIHEQTHFKQHVALPSDDEDEEEEGNCGTEVYNESSDDEEVYRDLG